MNEESIGFIRNEKRISKIGITGGIGSGKSIVSRVLRCNGFQVYDCDSEAKSLMMHDITLRRGLEKIIGSGIYNEKGELDRRRLAEMIFNDDMIREKVNHIVHREVRADIERKSQDSLYPFFIESAILSTGGLSPYCDSIWVVTAPLELRMKRTVARDSISPLDVKKRIASQENEISLLPENKIREIINDGKHSVIDQIITLLTKI